MANYTQIVLVTGANQGIGFETVKKLASEHDDYQIILTGRRKDAVDESVAKLNDLGLKNVEGLVLDINSDESIAAAARQVDEKYGRLDVLINNAAVASPGPQSRQRWLDIYNTNVVSVQMVTDAFIPLLEKSQVTKRIVNVSSNLSSMSLKSDPGHWNHKQEYGPYSVSKSALNMLTLHYVTRYMDDPTWKINMTCPGYCATNMNGYSGHVEASSGAINTARLATLGPDGPMGTFTDKNGVIAW